MPLFASFRACLFPRSLAVACGVAWAVACGVAREGDGAESASPPAGVSFSRQIQPLLAARCYKCHGPDAAQRQAELRLDVREAAVGKAFEPGRGAVSELVARITSTDEERAMPPASSKLPRLSSAEADLVRRWIDEGAKYDLHWSYAAPIRREPPAPADEATARWIRQPIDAFVAAGHATSGLSRAPEADRTTLVRRLYFDLVGLPPSPQEVDAFLNDAAPDAYERLVERLLASPHHAERLAMSWLDLVRYGDTNGYHADLHRNIHPYRDYVIRSFRDNVPFDRFTIEQLAGDLLPNATNEQLIASGYNRLNMTTTEGGAQPKEYLAKYAADRVRNVSTVWLGSTMGCCECHDHKFDPFSTRDFYSMAAFFSDLKQVGLYPNTIAQDPEIKVVTGEQQSQLETLRERVKGLETTLDTSTPELVAAQQAWEEKTQAAVKDATLAWQPLKPARMTSSGGATLTLQDDGSALSSGENPPTEIYTLTFELPERKLTGLRLEALTHPTLSDNKLSRSNGNFVLTEVEIELTPPGGQPQLLKIGSGAASHSQGGFPIEHAFDGKNDTGWAGEGHVKPGNRTAAFVLAESATIPANATLVVRLKHESIYPQHAIGRFRISVSSVDQPGLSEHGLPDDVVAALGVPRGERTPEQSDKLAKYYRGVAPALDAARASLVVAKKERDDFEAALPATLVSMVGEPRVTRILARGNWMDETGEIVTPAVPRFLGALSTEAPADRLGLARWIASRDNPLTARVFVNRIWRQFFGAGLSTSLGDVGAQGAAPSHPELLDWLAIEFVEKGWDVRHVVRSIVLSATYRQASAGVDESRHRDPANRWLARQSRWRLDAELVRDNALAISGLLSRKIGGRSVKPYQPEGYWDHCNTFMGKLVYDQDHGEDLYRRGMYTYWKRTFLHPSLAAFDAPSHEECTFERNRSSTPLQALVLLNDPTYVEAARVLAARLLAEAGLEPADKVQHAFRLALSRPARASEVELLVALYARHKTQYEADVESAKKLLAVGEHPAPADAAPAELAALTSIARAVLNLHETVTRP